MGVQTEEVGMAANGSSGSFMGYKHVTKSYGSGG